MPETLYVWRIYHVKTGPAKLVATVRAPDAKAAVMVAAVKLRLRHPESAKRLVAFRRDPAPPALDHQPPHSASR
jgi:hypothetical protein